MNYEAHFANKPDSKETRLRPYALKDIEMLAISTAKFVPELPNYKGFKVDHDRISYLLRHNLHDNSHFKAWVIVDPDDNPVGACAGFCQAGMLSWDEVATDVFFYVIPGWRSKENADKLMGAYKSWGLARGAVIVQASYTGGYEPELMARYMKRQGYRHVGSVWHIRADEMFIEKQLKSIGEKYVRT